MAESNNYAFKSHRDKVNNYLLPIHDMAAHPTQSHVFATCGGDGKYHMWDKVGRTALKASLKPATTMNGAALPIVQCAYNLEGSLFAYACGYDWGMGSYGNNGTHVNTVMITSVTPQDLQKKSTR